MTEWKPEYNTEKPDELSLVSSSTYIQRKDIHQVEISDGYTNHLQWYSLSRFLTKDELLMLEAVAEVRTDAAIDEYTLQLIEEGIL